MTATMDRHVRRAVADVVHQEHGECLELHQKTLQMHQALLQNLVEIIETQGNRIERLEDQLASRH